MNLNYLILTLTSALILTGCQPNTPDSNNVGKWTSLNEDYMEPNQFDLDRDYCDGKTEQVHIPAYVPYSAPQTTPSYFSGTVNTYNYNTNSFSNSTYSGTVTPTGGGFASGFSQGLSNSAAIANASARNQAYEKQNRIFSTCMKNFGWEKITSDSNELSNIFYDAHSTYLSKIKTLGYGNRDTVRQKLKSDKDLFEKSQNFLSALISLVDKNPDIKYTAQSSKLLAHIYLDGIIVEPSVDKYMYYLKKSAELGFVEAQIEYADVKYTGSIFNMYDKSDYSSHGKVSVYNNLVNINEAIYFYKQIATKYIPKVYDEKLVAGLGASSRPQGSIITIASQYKDILKARYMLGTEYFKGQNIEPNEKLGIEYITNAAERGYDIASWELFFYYYDKSDIKKSVYWMNTATREEFPEVMSAYFLNTLKIKNSEEYLYKLAEFKTQYPNEKLSSKAISFLSESIITEKEKSVRAYKKGMSTEDMYKQECENKNSKSCLELAQIFVKNGEPNYTIGNALIYNKKACDLGESKGCLNAAYTYNNANDFNTSALFHKRACDLGELSACHSLAEMYYEGKKLKRDAFKASELYEKACNNGNFYSCVFAGYLYKNKQNDFIEDYSKARKFFELACNNKQYDGCNAIAYMYKNGDGVGKDNTEALKYYKKACDSKRNTLFEAIACKQYEDFRKTIE